MIPKKKKKKLSLFKLLRRNRKPRLREFFLNVERILGRQTRERK